jgi:hypothetical protein
VIYKSKALYSAVFFPSILVYRNLFTHVYLLYKRVSLWHFAACT